MQAKLSQYVRVDTNSHSDSEGSTSGIGTATDNAYHILPASDSPVSSCPFSSSTTTSLVYGNGKHAYFLAFSYIFFFRNLTRIIYSFAIDLTTFEQFNKVSNLFSA